MLTIWVWPWWTLRTVVEAVRESQVGVGFQIPSAGNVYLRCDLQSRDWGSSSLGAYLFLIWMEQQIQGIDTFLTFLTACSTFNIQFAVPSFIAQNGNFLSLVVPCVSCLFSFAFHHSKITPFPFCCAKSRETKVNARFANLPGPLRERAPAEIPGFERFRAICSDAP